MSRSLSYFIVGNYIASLVVSIVFDFYNVGHVVIAWIAYDPAA